MAAPRRLASAGDFFDICSNMLFQSWPGYPWGGYPHRKLYAETRYLADVLPFSATFTGHLDKAEALYEGPQRNLVGVTTFLGAGANATPQHAVMLGMSGAGKSLTVCDLLSQTEAFYDYTVISRKDSRMKLILAQLNLARVRSSSSQMGI